MSIFSADNSFADTGLPPDRMAEAVLAPQFNGGKVPIPVARLADGVTLAVQVNDGRWIVQCPDCNSAQLASKADRRFYCIECNNIAHGGQWVAVTWPDDVADIEAVLLARPVLVTRNWVPVETVTDLVAENLDAGVPVPDNLTPIEVTGVTLDPVADPILDPPLIEGG